MTRHRIGVPLALATIVSLGALGVVSVANSNPYQAIDGDTIAHGDERLRLLGIDAPEMGGRCRQGRRCVEGDPVEARDALQRLLDFGKVECWGNRTDVYGRRLVRCWVLAEGTWIDLSQGMMDLGYAEPYRRP